MKTTVIYLSLILITTALNAQAPDGSINRNEMKKLAAWAGHWTGEGTVQAGPGGVSGKSTVNETIEMKLDGTIMVVEGIGTMVDPSTKKETVAHHAFGVVSYDVQSKSFRIKTYLKDGRGTDTWFNIVSETHYEWGFDTPGGKVKYTIHLDDTKTKWNEVGEFSQDGNTWHKFFEMNLTRKS